MKTIPSSTTGVSQFERQKIDGQTRILQQYIFRVLPGVKKALDYWERQAITCPNPELRRQALLSLKNKDFHCQGGAVFVVHYAEKRQELLDLIVAYQTICDYLDNLCDRAGYTDRRAFEQLHQALLDALCPGTCCQDYYKYYPHRDDGGYLQKLVEACQRSIRLLPSWTQVEETARELARLYIGLQVYKHLSIEVREEMLKQWVINEMKSHPGLYWQEFAASCGSTLAVFALMGISSRKGVDPNEIKRTVKAYFPWICGLHILLDYFIDRQEDQAGGDLNFTFYYQNEKEMMERLRLMVRQSHCCASSLQDYAFVKTVVEGLLAMYLSDKKIKQQGYQGYSRQLLQESGPSALFTFRICKVVRALL